MNDFDNNEFECLLKLNKINIDHVRDVANFFIDNGLNYVEKTGLIRLKEDDMYSNNFTLNELFNEIIKNYDSFLRFSATFGCKNNNLPYIFLSVDYEYKMVIFNLSEGNFIDQDCNLSEEKLSRLVTFFDDASKRFDVLSWDIFSNSDLVEDIDTSSFIKYKSKHPKSKLNELVNDYKLYAYDRKKELSS